MLRAGRLCSTEKQVQRLLGHTNAKAAQRYAHLARETLAEAAEAGENGRPGPQAGFLCFAKRINE
jgi:integrase